AEDRLEPEKAAEEHDQILQRAMALLADGALALLDERARRGHVSDVLEQNPAIPLPRRIETWRRVETTDERQQLREADVHCAARARTMAPDGSGRPGSGSTVTRTPVMRRGTLGSVSVAAVTRPDESGTN